MELTANAQTILEKRYLSPGESPSDMFKRVAVNIAAGEEDAIGWAREFYKVMADLDFLPNSPCLANAGKGNDLSYAACYVIPVGDSIEEIFDAVKHAAVVHKSGGGTGFSFSNLRPSGSRVHTTPGTASGPVSFMQVFDAGTGAIKQGGFRRGANMGVLSSHHPDIEEFISAKADGKTLSNFNISVAASDEFMNNVLTGKPLKLRWNGEEFDGRPTREIFTTIAENAWATGDPGLVFIDRANHYNPLSHLPAHRYETTNPCGEQFLPPWGVCNLGSINLGNFVTDKQFDVARFQRVVAIAVRFLDNVIDRTPYPLPQFKKQALLERRIGLGVMGLADALVKLGLRYGSEEALKFSDGVAALLQHTANFVSTELANEKAPFPMSKFCQPYGLYRRNLTVTCVAPTGTISLIAGCSSGIEPYFGTHNRVTSEGMKLFYEMNVPDELAVTSHELTYKQHIDVQAAWQAHIDNAISKTINLPHEATPTDIAAAYIYAYQAGCKGVTIYRDGSKDGQVLTHACPECGAEMIHQEGCKKCPSCGYSVC